MRRLLTFSGLASTPHLLNLTQSFSFGSCCVSFELLAAWDLESLLLFLCLLENFQNLFGWFEGSELDCLFRMVEIILTFIIEHQALIVV